MTAISVVLTTRNSENWLTDALDSVRAQTHARDQLQTIVVADGAGNGAAEIARAYLARHAMDGQVLIANRRLGAPAAMNLGWQAAAGEWIQFCSGRDILAPDKLEAQSSGIAQLPPSVAVVLSRWQHLRASAGQWLPADCVPCPRLAQSLLLWLLASPHRLGSALVRRSALEAVGGFSEDVAYASEEHLLLKIAGMGEDRPLFNAAFAARDTPLPLYFERDVCAQRTRRWKAATARQHLENILVARAMLLRHGLFTAEDQAHASRLSGACLGELRSLDRAAFRRSVRRVAEIDPRLLPVGASRRLDVLQWTAVPTHIQRASMPSRHAGRGLQEARIGLARASARSAQRLRRHCRAVLAVPHEVCTAGALAVSAPRRRAAAASGALATVALLGAIVAFGPLAMPSTSRGEERIPDAMAVTRTAVAPTIVVTSIIYAEPASPWPVPIAIGPPGGLPPGSFLQIRGLPPDASLSRGRRVALDLWAVPLALVANLEIEVPAGTSGRSDLTLALCAGDGRVLAEARTALSVNESPVAKAVPPPAGALPGEGARQARAGQEEVRAMREGASGPPAESPRTAGESTAAETGGASIRATSLGEALAPAGADPSRLAAAAEPLRPEPAAPQPPAGRAIGETAPAAALAEADRARGEWMIARGERDLADGNVATARQFFLRAAEAGLARGAILLASTYDVHEFARLHIQGVQPNAQMARTWYQRARALGAGEADALLLRLGSGG
jgi:glycosyltransferase involved in cell wall biosynthesis